MQMLKTILLNTQIDFRCDIKMLSGETKLESFNVNKNNIKNNKQVGNER